MTLRASSFRIRSSTAEGAIPTAMRLAESATFASGAVLLVYEPDGEPTYGDLSV